MTQAELLNKIKVISKNAGKAIMEVYDRDAELAVSNKEDNSPLTEADLASHHIIISALKELTADIPVLSEESSQISWNERKAWSRYWLVDPLDGTKEFINRNGEFTVNIALIDEHRPMLGVVYVPARKILYSGHLDLGAFKEAEGSEQSIKVRKIQQGSPLKVVASRNHRGEELDGWLDRVRNVFPELELVNMGSSLKICLVAEGKADIYPRLALTSEWDTAAAQAILEAAGGKLMDVDFKVYRYNLKENILNPYFFAIGDSQFKWQDL
jgi:3'(2'), 5'-bisphosphate nucleotidase